MTILPGLLHTMSRLNHQYTAFPGTVVSTAVYEYDYAELGTLIGELRQTWDALPISWGPDRPFVFAEYDPHSGFDEFVCTLVEHWLEQVGVHTECRGDCERWHQGRLDALANLFEGAIGHEIHDRAVDIPTVIDNVPAN